MTTPRSLLQQCFFSLGLVLAPMALSVMSVDSPGQHSLSLIAAAHATGVSLSPEEQKRLRAQAEQAHRERQLEAARGRAKAEAQRRARSQADAERRTEARKAIQAKSTQQLAAERRARSQKVTQRKPAPRAARLARNPEDRMSSATRSDIRSRFDREGLSSSSALVIDQISGEILYEKNASAVLPIASITKVMTALVMADAVSEGQVSWDDEITLTRSDAELVKKSTSRLPLGSTFDRSTLLHLALMSSDNRAAHALGRSYPGGLQSFVRAMNTKARELGMTNTYYVEPTGLSEDNVSTARDLAILVEEAARVPEIREFSTDVGTEIEVRGRTLKYVNSNALARGGDWQLGLSKTGFIRAAGRCLVMQASIDQRPVVIVMLDSQDKRSRLRDAERLRDIIEQRVDRPRQISDSSPG